jgi:hypothetical protein
MPMPSSARVPGPPSRRTVLCRAGVALAAATTGLAAALPARSQPKASPGSPSTGAAGRPVLTLRAQVKGAPERVIVLTMADIAALPQHSFSTRTPWYPKARKFTGPLLRDLLRHHGIEGATLLRAFALNNYRADIPAEDVLRHDVVLARLIDDQPMAIRDKGPLFIIYPFDSDDRLQSERYYNRCAWQLKALEAR